VGTTFSGVISGNGGGSLVKQGSSTFTLTGTSTYDGGTTIAGGTLALSGSGAAAGTGTIAVGSQRLNIESGATVANAVSIDGGTVGNTTGSGTLAGPMTLLSTSNLATSGSALTVSGGIGESTAGAGLNTNGINIALSGNNTYTGTTTVAGGTLHASNDTALPDNGAVALADGAGAVLDLTSNQRIGSLAGGANGGLVTLGANTLSTGGNANPTTFSGVISGSGADSLVKEGSGSFTLAGINTYSGKTVVNQGTLAVANALASPTLVVNGGTLALQAADVLPDTATLTVASPGSVTLGAAEAIGSLVLAGTLGGNGTLTATTYQVNGGTTLASADIGHGALSSSGSSTLNGRSAADTLTVTGGTLTLRSGGATLSALPTVNVGSGAALALRGDESIHALVLQGTLDGTGTMNSATYALNGGVANANLGAGALSSDGNSRINGTSAANSLAVKTGIVTLGSDGRFTAAPAVDVSANATFALGVGNETIGTLGGAGTVDLGDGTLSTGSGGDSTFGGVITGIGKLTKQGSGSFTLTGENLYSGVTRIDAGTLVVGNGASNGSLASSVIIDNGVLRSARADNVTFAQSISGTGGVEQAGTGRLTLQGNNKSYEGNTQVSSGELATTGDGALPLKSAVTVATGSQLTLGGSELVKSVDADGGVAIASLLQADGPLNLKGPVSAIGGAAITLNSKQQINAINDGNLFGSQLNIVAGGSVNLASGKDGNGARRDLVLGTVDVSNGGQIDAAVLKLADNVNVHAGTLTLASSAAAVGTQPDADLVGKITPAQRQVSFAGDVVQQTGGTINVDSGATLSVQASNGGSVQLLSENNLFTGSLAVLAGGAVSPWAANLQTLTFGGSALEYSVQSRVRIAGTTVNVGGSGIEGDVVAIKADTLATATGASIVARLPFDNLIGTTTSTPGLTLELTPVAFGLSFPFGGKDSAISINVGSKAWGGRTVIPVDGGYMTVLPRGGAKGSTSAILLGPQIAGTYGFFFDGAGQQTEIPVFYNGTTPVTPQVSGSISATVSVSESARKERFEEAVRTENVAVRLRSGVIAEVGAGRPATVGIEGARLPVGCTPAPGALACGAP
jgi:autotransporter-associated beta strand protein